MQARFRSRCSCAERVRYTTRVRPVGLPRLAIPTLYCGRSPPRLKLNEFDLGLRANLRATFGARRCGALLHLLPLPAPPVGDGMRFESRPRARVV